MFFLNNKIYLLDAILKEEGFHTTMFFLNDFKLKGDGVYASSAFPYNNVLLKHKYQKNNTHKLLKVSIQQCSS